MQGFFNVRISWILFYICYSHKVWLIWLLFFITSEWMLQSHRKLFKIFFAILRALLIFSIRIYWFKLIFCSHSWIRIRCIFSNYLLILIIFIFLLLFFVFTSITFVLIHTLGSFFLCFNKILNFSMPHRRIDLFVFISWSKLIHQIRIIVGLWGYTSIGHIIGSIFSRK